MYVPSNPSRGPNSSSSPPSLNSHMAYICVPADSEGEFLYSRGRTKEEAENYCINVSFSVYY